MKITDKIRISSLRKKGTQSSTEREIKILKPAQYKRILLINSLEEPDLIKAAQLAFKNAEISQLYLREKKEDSDTSKYSIHPSDFNLTGQLKNDKLSQLQKSGFELIIDLHDESELLKYCFRSIKSNLIVGKLNSSDPVICDLFVESGKNNKEFLDNMIKQLNVIASHEK